MKDIKSLFCLQLNLTTNLLHFTNFYRYMKTSDVIKCYKNKIAIDTGDLCVKVDKLMIKLHMNPQDDFEARINCTYLFEFIMVLQFFCRNNDYCVICYF